MGNRRIGPKCGPDAGNRTHTTYSDRTSTQLQPVYSATRFNLAIPASATKPIDNVRTCHNPSQSNLSGRNRAGCLESDTHVFRPDNHVENPVPIPSTQVRPRVRVSVVPESLEQYQQKS
jgi:hypothetical protein